MLKTLTFKSAIHLEPFSFHHALCTLTITALAFITLYFLSTPQPSWLLFPTLLFSQGGLSAEGDWQFPWQTLFYLFCGLITAFAVLLISFLSSFSFLATTPILFLTSFTASYLGWRQRQYFFAALSFILLTLIATYLPCDLHDALERASLILLGSLLVFLIRFLSFLYQRVHTLNHNKALFFQKLKQLYQLIFYASSQRRPLFGNEAEESHFQIIWSDCLTALHALKAKSPKPNNPYFDRLWDLSLSLGSLRYRLTDFTVLTMSQDEMQSLLKAITTLLDRTLYNSPKDPNNTAFTAFETAIQGFEELYRSVLQTVAKEPLVLLLFIQDLYALKETFEEMEQQCVN